MSVRPTPEQQIAAYQSVWRLIRLIETGQVKEFDQETLDYLKQISLYKNFFLQRSEVSLVKYKKNRSRPRLELVHDG